MPFGQHRLLKGRDKELESVREALIKQGRLAVTGPPGVGKTQLAVEYAYRFEPEYHGVIWCTGTTADQLTAGWSELADYVKLPHTEDVKRLQEGVRHRLESQQDALLILIDAVVNPALLAPFLPRTGTTHILLTGLDRGLDLLGIYEPLRLEELRTPDAVSFLLNRAGRTATSGVELDAAVELAERELKGFPLALEQAGAYITNTRCAFADYLKGFRSRRLNLLEADKPANYPTSLVNILSETLREISETPASLTLARLIAFLDENALPRELLFAAVHEYGSSVGSSLIPEHADPLGLDESLVPLFAYGLIREDSFSREYRMHRLIRLIIRELIPEDTRALMEGVVVKACDSYAEDIDFLALTGRAVPRSYGVPAANLAFERGMNSVQAGQLLRKVGEHLIVAGEVNRGKEMLSRSAEILTSAFGPKGPELTPAILALGIATEKLDRETAPPYYLQVIAAPSSPKGLKAVAQNNLGEIYRDQKRFRESKVLLDASLAARQELFGSEHAAIATALNNLGNLNGQMGLAGDISRFKVAESHYRRAYEMRKAILAPPHHFLANSLNNLGWIYLQLGWLKKAEQPLREALAMWEELYGPEHSETLITLNNLVRVCRRTQRVSEAKELEQRISAAKQGSAYPESQAIP